MLFRIKYISILQNLAGMLGFAHFGIENDIVNTVLAGNFDYILVNMVSYFRKIGSGELWLLCQQNLRGLHGVTGFFAFGG